MSETRYLSFGLDEEPAEELDLTIDNGNAAEEINRIKDEIDRLFAELEQIASNEEFRGGGKVLVPEEVIDFRKLISMMSTRAGLIEYVSLPSYMKAHGYEAGEKTAKEVAIDFFNMKYWDKAHVLAEMFKVMGTDAEGVPQLLQRAFVMSARNNIPKDVETLGVQKESKVDQVITMADNKKFYVLEETYRGARRFFLLSLLDDKENLTQTFSLVEEKEVNGKVIMESINDQALLNDVGAELLKRAAEV